MFLLQLFKGSVWLCGYYPRAFLIWRPGCQVLGVCLQAGAHHGFHSHESTGITVLHDSPRSQKCPSVQSATPWLSNGGMLILHGNMHSYQCFIGNPVFTLRFEVAGYPGTAPIKEHQDAPLTTSSPLPCQKKRELQSHLNLNSWRGDLMFHCAINTFCEL